MAMGVSGAAGGGRRRGRSSRRTPMADINVTPLVDVMLVLLIIFMVTAPLLKAGVPPNDQENGGCSAIQSLLQRLEGYGSTLPQFKHLNSGGGDDPKAREMMRGIHILAKAGGRWVPEDQYQLNTARRSLIQMTADYTAEFVWIMGKFHACSHETAVALLRTPTIKKRTQRVRKRIAEILSQWQDADPKLPAAQQVRADGV